MKEGGWLSLVQFRWAFMTAALLGGGCNQSIAKHQVCTQQRLHAIPRLWCTWHAVSIPFLDAFWALRQQAMPHACH